MCFEHDFVNSFCMNDWSDTYGVLVNYVIQSFEC